MAYYVYVLQSQRDKKFYTGYTKDLKKRLRLHYQGRVISTKDREPLKLIYFEWGLNEKDAIHRERYLKTTYGKRYLRNRLRNYLTG